MQPPSSKPSSTCWTLIQGAADGSSTAREEFARRYQAVVEAYLRARWRCSPLLHEVHDVAQEVFLECFKEGGALERARRGLPAGFRGFLYGVVRNVAARHEERGSRRPPPQGDTEVQDARATEEDPEAAFLRSWAESVMEQAGALQAERARYLGPAAQRRVEILRLRFEEDLPVREVAGRLGLEAAYVHKQYAEARREFQEALREVVGFNAAGTIQDIDDECRYLLELLGSGPPTR